MTASERGVLLLCSHLGDPGAKPLTLPQYRRLSLTMAALAPETDQPDARLVPAHLTALGYDAREAARLAALLDREARLARYLDAGSRLGIAPLTRLSGGYPPRLIQTLGVSCPPVLFCAGNLSLLATPCVGLVGSRALRPAGGAFARRVGELAAEEGLTLVTGGAAGADAVALEACLKSGGRAVVFVPDELRRRLELAGENCLVCSEGGYDLGFTAARALTRNAYVHAMGNRTFIAQTGYGAGGTWRGAMENLKRGWSRLCVHDDGSRGAAALIGWGAEAVSWPERLSGPVEDEPYFL